jgi:hypothetical protein
MDCQKDMANLFTKFKFNKDSSTDQKRQDAKHLKQFLGAVKNILSGSIKHQSSQLVASEIARLYEYTAQSLVTLEAKRKLDLELEKLSSLEHIDFLEVGRVIAQRMQSEQDLPKAKRTEMVEKAFADCLASIHKALSLIFPQIWIDSEYVKQTMDEHIKTNFKKVIALENEGKAWWKEVSELVVACYLVLYSRLLDGNREQRRKVLTKIKNLSVRQRIAEVVDKSLHDIVAGGYMVARILHLETESSF